MFNTTFIKLNFKEFIILFTLFLNFLSSSYATYQHNKRLDSLISAINMLKTDIKEDFIKHMINHNASLEKAVAKFSELSQKNDSIKDAFLTKISNINATPKIIITTKPSYSIYDYLVDPKIIGALLACGLVVYGCYSVYSKYLYVTSLAASYTKGPFSSISQYALLDFNDKTANKVIDIDTEDCVDKIIDVSSIPETLSTCNKTNAPRIFFIDVDKLVSETEQVDKTVFFDINNFPVQDSLEDKVFDRDLAESISNIFDMF